MLATIRQKIVDSLNTPMPKFTRRDIHLPKVKGKALAVIGMRRTGKTTFMWQMLSDRLAQGLAREGLLYFSFEDERLAEMSAGDLQMVLEEYYRLHPEWRDSGKRAAFFFDEIQNVPGWESFARRILDTEDADLFLSGSSAKMLSREVATSMRGRAMEALVHPFSFREFLRHHEAEPKSRPDELSKAGRSALEKRLLEYLACGGFPEVQSIAERDRFDLLKSYVDVVLLRDIIERHEVSHPHALRWMVRHLLGNAAGSFSVNKFYGDLRSQGMQVSKDTLYAYLSYLEDSFLIRVASVASDSERKRMANPREAYPVDPGLIPLFDRSGKTNVGHALETAVMIELERRGAEISYVKTDDGLEVDFLAQYPGAGTQLIQVCADLDSEETLKREVKALLSAAKAYPKAKPVLVCLNPYAVKGIPKQIKLESASEWLLEASAN